MQLLVEVEVAGFCPLLGTRLLLAPQSQLQLALAVQLQVQQAAAIP
jgi:hypothetical protein